VLRILKDKSRFVKKELHKKENLYECNEYNKYNEYNEYNEYNGKTYR
jgi:hypothetical protein